MFERLYRVLLVLLPRDMRERFGTEILDTARAIDADRPRGARRTLRALADVVATPLRLRADLREERRGQSRAASGGADAWLHDLRGALRGLRRDRAFAAFVAATLALGIGANAAMFGLADRLLLQGPTHIRDASQVVRVYDTVPFTAGRTFTGNTFGYVTYDLLKRGSRTLEGVATYSIQQGLVGDADRTAPATLGYASADLFPLLSVRPIAGSFFAAADDATSGAARVVVLGYGAWQDWFGGDPAAVGETVRLNHETFTVVGVAPRGFTGPQLRPVDAWLPGNVLGARMGANFTTSWSSQWLQIVGRLRPGVTIDEVNTDLTDVYRRGYTGDEAPRLDGRVRLSVAPLLADETGNSAVETRILWWLIGVAIAVLCIACANVANLVLARGVRRQGEIAVRAALGAGRSRLARLLFIEAGLLALIGAAGGLVVAHLVGGAARRALFPDIEWPSPPVDLQVAAVSLLLALLTTVVVTIVPMMRASRPRLTEALRTGPRDGGGRRTRVRTALTVVQAALSVVLLIGAGLFVHSLWRIHGLDLGFDADRVVVVDVSRESLARFPAGAARETERARRRTFFLDVLDRVRALPGVEAATVAVGMPFGNRFTVRVRVPEVPTLPQLPGGGPGVSAVSSSYFDTMGTRIIRGRAFGSGDGAGSEPVVIVSALMAETIWPGVDPLGKCFHIGPDTPPCSRIVGIAENTFRSQLREHPVMHYYVPVGQEPGFGGAVLLVRARADADVPVAEIRRLLTGLDRGITYVEADRLGASIDPQKRPWRVGATVFVLAGGLAVLVAALGLYSVMSYLVAERRREIGVRLALGARTADIVALILRGGLAMALAGIVLGEIAAVSLGGLVAPLLFNTSPREPVVFGAIAALLVGVAVLASLPPASRARRVSPIEVLRAE